MGLETPWWQFQTNIFKDSLVCICFKFKKKKYVLHVASKNVTEIIQSQQVLTLTQDVLETLTQSQLARATESLDFC